MGGPAGPAAPGYGPPPGAGHGVGGHPYAAPHGVGGYAMAPYAGPMEGGFLTDPKAREFATFIHLSQLAGFFFPFLGLILPIILWQTKKDELPGIDAHGKAVTNWIISEIIYGVVCVILTLVIVGAFLLMALALASIAFSIIGAVKANKGELWHYPLTIKFLK
ncbi:MAG: DUF4870 domain-containing protein [Myxococcota bacterium]